MNEAIIEPRREPDDPDLTPDALMVMVQPMLKQVLAGKRHFKWRLRAPGLDVLYRVEHGQRILTVAGPFLGAPHAAMAMEKLVVLGARRLWILGWCGSLQPDIRVGALIVPTEAVPEEGTSPHYPVGFPLKSDDALTAGVELELQSRGVSYHKGPVWTTDALYRETRSKVLAFQDRGVLGVEMEMSALLAVSRYRCVGVSGLLVVSDELADLKWRPAFSDPRLRAASHTACEVVWSAAGKAADYT